ncbi:MAG TPA: hypothetical protein DCY20_08325 [Firmicutes bacterium]|nr:hypothetical protein [Bacillota bacterium]
MSINLVEEERIPVDNFRYIYSLANYENDDKRHSGKICGSLNRKHPITVSDVVYELIQHLLCIV